MVAMGRKFAADIRGAAKLAFDATLGTTGVVERMHRTIQDRPAPFAKAPPALPTRGITGLIYGAVRTGMHLAGRGVDLSLGVLQQLLPDAPAGPGREAWVAAVNGIHGDHLARTGNPLAIEMSLRSQGRTIDAARPAHSLQASGGAAPGGRLLILVHGLCMNDLRWRRDGHDHGAALAEDLGFTALYLHYNSGLHIGENGQAFAALLDTLVRHWPCAVDELVIVGHSMGGLVARSACAEAARQGQPWLQRLRKLVFLGTPHHGSPLERGGRRIDEALGLSPYSAPLARLGKSRSAGIQDLRHGTFTRNGHQDVALPEGVECFAAAATLGAKRNGLAGRLVGDGLVPVASALGQHRDPARALHLPESRQWIGSGMGHLELLSRPEVYERLRTWLQPAASGQNA